MSIWDTPASDEPLLPKPATVSREDIEAAAKRVDKDAIKRRLKKWQTPYRCCPSGCCMCRRY